MERWARWQGKKVFIILKSNRKYTGVILEVEIKSDEAFITIKDKFGSMVGISSSEIELIQEEK